MLKMGIKIEFTPLVSLSLTRLHNLSLSQKMTYHSLLSDIEDEEVDIHPSPHHENTPGRQKTFLSDVQILYQALMQNSPFSLGELLCFINNGQVYNTVS